MLSILSKVIAALFEDASQEIGKQLVAVGVVHTCNSHHTIRSNLSQLLCVCHHSIPIFPCRRISQPRLFKQCRVHICTTVFYIVFRWETVQLAIASLTTQWCLIENFFRSLECHHIGWHFQKLTTRSVTTGITARDQDHIGCVTRG